MRPIKIFCVLGLAFAAPAFAVSPKVGPALAARLAARPEGPQDVLVYLKDQANLDGAQILTSKRAKGVFVTDALRAAALRAQGPLRAYLGLRRSTVTSFYVANVILVHSASATLIDELAQRADVARILGDPVVRALPAPTVARLTPDGTTAVGDNIKHTNADRAWNDLGVEGAGVVVAGQDTGVQWDHPALRASYRGAAGGAVNHDFAWHDAIHSGLRAAANPCGYDLAAPCDDHGHGTHTMGTMVGDDGRGNRIGMAPAATWMACRNMDAGAGKPSTYLECFQYFLAPWAYGADPATGDAAKAPDVVNNSWECLFTEGCDGTEFLEVLGALKAAGIVVVAAAGNSGGACKTILNGPAHNSDLALQVGAIDHRNSAIATFSSRGPSTFDGALSPDLTAPGVDIRSAIPGGGFSAATWDGTSMAAPHVAGAVALLWSGKPALRGDVDGTVAALRAAAVPRRSSQSCGGVPGTQTPNNTYGYGYLDIYKALTAP